MYNFRNCFKNRLICFQIPDIHLGVHMFFLENIEAGPLKLIVSHRTGAPKENIVQNHLNIALLNVF